MECPWAMSARYTPKIHGTMERTLVRSLASALSLHPYKRFNSLFLVKGWFYTPRFVISSFPNLGFHLTDIQDNILRLMSQDRQRIWWKYEKKKMMNLIVDAFDIIKSNILNAARQRFQPVHHCRWPSKSEDWFKWWLLGQGNLPHRVTELSHCQGFVRNRLLNFWLLSRWYSLTFLSIFAHWTSKQSWTRHSSITAPGGSWSSCNNGCWCMILLASGLRSEPRLQ
jgi:hypothetical protein